MARKDMRTDQQKIKALEAELAEKERELNTFRTELSKINKQLEKFIQQLGGELKLAALIQRSLVPTEMPNISGFEFSTKFVASPISGGDYFDIFEHEDKMRFGLLMANSSGHGMASLFMSVLMKMTSQIEARKGMGPDEVMTHMAKEIQGNVKSLETSNIFYGVVDKRRYSLSFCRAGKVPVYLYKYADDKLVMLETHNTAIGKGSKTNFKVETIGLDPRDKLVIVSEGVIKAKNSEGEPFTEDRVFQTILDDPRATCHGLRNEILFQVKKFSQGQDYPQDLSVIVMEVKDKVIKLRKG